MDLTFFELFAGAGGMSMGLEMAGWRCIGHAEIEPHARAVLRHHWPETPLHGDVSQIDGIALRGVTMITGGSPCQDLSIAGKRAGMTKDSGTRSSLFFEQIRIWHESEAPFILWENVYGAFSSQQGRDFAAVLSAVVKRAVPVPADGWRGAGVASGPAGVAAWRTLDAQYFGVPQRRRVFVLGTRVPGVDPAEVLSLAESLSGDTSPSGKAGKNVATGVASGIRSESKIVGPIVPKMNSIGFTETEHLIPRSLTCFPIDTRNATRTTDKDEQNRQGLGIGEDGNPSSTLTNLFVPGVVTYEWHGADTRLKETALSPTLNTRQDNGQGNVMVLPKSALTYEWHNQDSRIKPVEVAATLNLNGDGKEGHLVMHTFSTPAIDDIREDAVASAMTANTGGGGETQNPAFVIQIQEPVIGIDKQQAMPFENIAPTLKTDLAHQMGPILMRNREGKPGGGKGPLLNAERSLTLSTANDQVLFAGIPRRLTPIECERLMGWPDAHTAHGVNESGKAYELADTARYKLCGNGIASPVVAWIGFGLKEAV